MSGLHKPGELGRWNQGDVARTSSPDNDSFLLIYHLGEHGGEILTETGIRRFPRHVILNFIVQYSCTFLGSPVPEWTDYSDTGLSASPCERYAEFPGVIRLQRHITPSRRGRYATRSSAVPRLLGFTTISTSCPSATRKRMRRSTEYPRNRPASIAEILG